MTRIRRRRPANGPDRMMQVEGMAKEALDRSRNRLFVSGALFALAFVVVGVRLFDLALNPNGREPRLAEAPQFKEFRTTRPDIVDRNGIVLATNLATASLYADPLLVSDPAETAALLVVVLPELDAADVQRKLSAERRFVWISRNLTPRQQYAVNRIGLPGLSFQREERRVYPHGRLAAHVLGYTGVDNRGLAGIERYIDGIPRPGSGPLSLSLDIRIQHILDEELSAAVAEFDAVGGAGLVVDPRSGEILALVSLPSFDPHRPGQASAEARFNRTTLGVYEMGSTLKIFTTAMALDIGTVTLTDGYDATNPLRVARFTIRDYHGKRRWLSVPEIFVYSSNIGAAKMAQDVGTERQRAFLDSLGLLTPARIELPETGRPMVPSPWREINTMTIGFGHGLAISPLQLANAVSTVINGGIALRSTMLKTAQTDAIPGVRVMSRETSDYMRMLMRLVVTQGTGRKARVPGYMVGGKSGTAEKIGPRGYQHGALLSSFVGAFPMTEPRYIVMAMLDEPKGNEETHGYATGGWVAAPVVGRVIQRIAPISGVPPVEEESPDLRQALLVNAAAWGQTLAPN